MNRIITIMAIALFAMSCGEMQDGVLSLNDAPFINFNNNAETALLEDSIKLSLKNSQERYTVELKVFDDNENITLVSYDQQFGQGILLQQGDTITGNDISLEDDILSFEYYPTDIGFHKFTLRVTDSFDATSSVSIELEAFNNLKPVTEFKVSKDGKYGLRHYVISAKESYDRDEHFGGGIVAYEYRVLGKIYIYEVTGEGTEDPSKLDVIFPSKDIYTIGVRVQDNDGAWSDLKQSDIPID